MHFVEGFGFSDPPAEGSGAETSKTMPDPACFFCSMSRNYIKSLMWGGEFWEDEF